MASWILFWQGFLYLCNLLQIFLASMLIRILFRIGPTAIFFHDEESIKVESRIWNLISSLLTKKNYLMNSQNFAGHNEISVRVAFHLQDVFLRLLRYHGDQYHGSILVYPSLSILDLAHG